MDDREKGSEDKTEEASDERRKQYREEGNIANPREIVSSLSLLVFALLCPFAGKALYESLGLSFRRVWGHFTLGDWTHATISKILNEAVTPLLPSLAIGSLGMLTLPVMVGLIATQFNWSWKKLELNIGAINPISGLGRMFSAQVLIELGRNILKFLVFGSVVFVIIRRDIYNSVSDMGMALPTLANIMGNSFVQLCTAVAVAGLIFGVFDFGFNWWRIDMQMKMSKQEVKEEIKGQEGDPLVKSQRRRMARDIATRRTLKEVPNATFIVTNPEHFAVALRYVKGMNAPLVVAKGQDFLALRIREIAKQNDIMLVENKALARVLYKTVKVGQEVPQSLYSSIIEIMKFIYQAKGRNYFDRFNLTGVGA